MNQSPEILLLAALDKSIHTSEESSRHKADELLTFIYSVVNEYPHILWNNPQVWKIAKAYLLLFHFDMLETEEENCKLLKQSYMFAQRSIDICEKQPELMKSEDYFQALHTQFILLQSCEEFFEGFVAELYVSISTKQQEASQISYRLAQKVLPIITYNRIVKIDDAFDNFHNDPYLEEMCNQFETENSDITPKQIEEAEKVHTLLIHSFVKENIA
jgi:hypothetical protein